MLDTQIPHQSSPEVGSPELVAIWIKPARRLPMRSMSSARLVAGRGIADNANQGGKRQVTILAEEAWRKAEEALGREVDPALRRANLLVRGVDLEKSRGKTLRIGSCRIRIIGETRPCRLMDEQAAGLRTALDPDWRAGAYGQVLDDGRIELGDEVAWVD